MGAVYEATDERLGRTVAVKELIVEGDELRRAFGREARLLANLSHPALPRVTDHFAEGEGHFLVMDFIPGDDLKKLTESRRAPFSVETVLRWAVQLLDALEYLHSHEPPVIHRDVKPANLKLLKDGRVVLLDFGLAKGGAAHTQAATTSRSVFGYSPHFASLEQMQGERSTARSDLYSLSATLYYLLTARVPPDSLTRAAAVFNEEPDPLVPIRDLNPDVPGKAAGLIMSGLELRTSARPPSAAAMRAQLTPLISDGAAPDEDATRVARRLEMQERPSDAPALQARARPSADDSAPEHLDLQESLPSGGAGRRALAALGVLCILAALTVGGYMLLSPPGARPARPESSGPTIPEQLKPAAAAAATLWATDADGNKLAGGGGVFVATDEAVVPLTAIQGASDASISGVSTKAVLRVTGVIRVDRERRAAVVKVEGGGGTPVTMAAKSSPKAGDRVKLLGIGSDLAVKIADGTVAVEKGSIEVRTADTSAAAGWVALRETGEADGLLTDWIAAGRLTLLPAPAIADLMKKKTVSQPLAVAGAIEVLFDFRDSDTGLDAPKLSSQEEDFIFASVFGPKPDFVEDEYIACEDDRAKCLAAERAAWRIRPEVRARVAGAFTQPGVQQTAYLIAVNERYADHADNFGTKRLAIFEGRRLVLDVDIGDHGGILKTFDLNRDGTSELLLEGGFMQMGHETLWSKLIEFRGGRQRVVKDFGDVYAGDCGAKDDGQTFGVQVLYTPAARGSFPQGFRQDVYRTGCGDQSNWKYVPGGSIPSL
jgi:hypothetical protein